jgi:hypothetical protein
MRNLFRLEMLAAIYFDDQLRRMANEVRDIRPDRGLSSKCGTVESMRPHSVPNDALGIRQVLSKRFRTTA